VNDPHRSILLVSSVGYAHGWLPHGLGLIKGYLTKTTDFRVETLSLCVTFSDYVRKEHAALAPYDQQMGEWGSSFHELYFSASYFGHAEPDALLRNAVADYLTGGDIFRLAPWDERKEARPALVEFHTARIREFCRLLDRFSHDELARALEKMPFLIGFSVTAQQLYASAVLARACRRTCPDAVIVFGGPAITTVSAGRILELFPEIDAVVLGDGEEVMRLVATAVTSKRSIARIPGVLARGKPALLPSGLVPAAPPPLDEIPAPDWDELEGLLANPAQPLTTWMGRGCSWGRCSFCSIPEFQRKLFNRSPQRILDDLLALHRRYGAKRFRFGDWEVNGSSEKLAELCQLLTKSEARLEFWAEVNARNLTSLLVGAMKQAGFVSLQVGIEAFSSTLLRKMKKPATLLENIQALLYAHEHQIELFSNLLYNFPGEAPDDIAETLAVIRRIRHLLRPPVTVALLEFLLETDADIYGQIDGASEHVGAPYKFESSCLPRAITDGGPYFLKQWTHPVNPEWRQVHEELGQCRSGSHSFTHRALDGAIVLEDDRGGARETNHLSATESAVYRRLVGKKVTREVLAAELPEMSESELDRCLTGFHEAGWVLHDRMHLLALSVPHRDSIV
jgi:radical SAM superfamily enzyme YgiQ (UPF0313 family)